MKKKRYYNTTLALLLAAAVLPACKDTKSDSDPASEAATVGMLDQFYTDSALADAKHISEVFADPSPGREIVLAGEVMGRMKPFVEGRSMVVLGDPTKITPCNRIPGDLCETPWDNCCTDPDLLKKSIATIQFLDAEGKVLRQGVKGFKGIEELSYLTVKGTIANGSNSDNLLVNAESFQIVDPSPFKDAPPAFDQNLPEGVTIIEEDDVFIYKKE